MTDEIIEKWKAGLVSDDPEERSSAVYGVYFRMTSRETGWRKISPGCYSFNERRLPEPAGPLPDDLVELFLASAADKRFNFPLAAAFAEKLRKSRAETRALSGRSPEKTNRAPF